MQGCHFVESHKSAGCGPVRSPETVPAKEKTKQKQQKHTTKTKTKQKRQRAVGSPVAPLAQGCIGSNPVGLGNLIFNSRGKHPSWVICVS